ncbi:hypothetical protein PSE_1352 [Pseudovibrio sp. FO-BEG1]|nr:hypothetical protein PSE_1352 [Pseudovibrio sp. FO-BEG1]EEA92075.1 hypothetical protein PJE062_1892 [Pseudovibrio sp. JE062]
MRALHGLSSSTKSQNPLVCHLPRKLKGESMITARDKGPKQRGEAGNAVAPMAEAQMDSGAKQRK